LHDNSDIKDVLSSAEKSLHSIKADSLYETRIKASNEYKPLDLIAEYRNTITERYAQKVLGKQTIDSNSTLNPQQNQMDESSLPKTRNNGIYKIKAHTHRNEPENSKEDTPQTKKPKKRRKSFKKLYDHSLLATTHEHTTTEKPRHCHKASLDSSIKVQYPSIS